MIDETVVVIPHDPRWSAQAAAAAAEVSAALSSSPVILHIGSTAVPGLPAKPILDLMADIGPDDSEAAAQELVRIGFADFGEVSAGRRYLTRRTQPAVNVHLIEAASPLWRNNLAFRDYLRAHPQAAASYGNLKLRMADGRGLLAYSDAKASTIIGILAAAQTWAVRGS